MRIDILSWYRRSKIEGIIERVLARSSLQLSYPKISYVSQGIAIDRHIEELCGETKKRMGVRREFFLDGCNETILFELEDKAIATIYCYSEDSEYRTDASCYFHNKIHKALLSRLHKHKDIDLCISETLRGKDITGYYIEGNTTKLAMILASYWTRQLRVPQAS